MLVTDAQVLVKETMESNPFPRRRKRSLGWLTPQASEILGKEHRRRLASKIVLHLYNRVSCRVALLHARILSGPGHKKFSPARASHGPHAREPFPFYRPIQGVSRMPPDITPSVRLL